MSERRPKRQRSTSLSSRLAAAEARIGELESELEAANRTIGALIDKAERSREAPMSSEVAVFEATARMEAIIGERTREVEEKSRALAAANSELRAVMANLDQIVRQRTRALAESEAQLREKNRELDRLNRLRAEFISIAAHELRTPMTSIVGYLDLMAEGRFGKLVDTLVRPMTSLRRNAHRLQRLVEEMLDVSRIEAGRVELFRTDCALGDVVREAAEQLEPLAEEKQQRLRIDVRDVPAIEADADKLHQIVTNLIANSIRYTEPDGEIAVIVDHSDEPDARAWVRLRVRDNGIGIPEAHYSRIFEPFSDVHTAKHHSSSGPGSAGLGLYIARGLVELHGGIITVDSREGEFTEFTVLLPISDTRAVDRNP